MVLLLNQKTGNGPLIYGRGVVMRVRNGFLNFVMAVVLSTAVVGCSKNGNSGGSGGGILSSGDSIESKANQLVDLESSEIIAPEAVVAGHYKATKFELDFHAKSEVEISGRIIYTPHTAGELHADHEVLAENEDKIEMLDFKTSTQQSYFTFELPVNLPLSGDYSKLNSGNDLSAVWNTLTFSANFNGRSETTASPRLTWHRPASVTGAPLFDVFAPANKKTSPKGKIYYQAQFSEFDCNVIGYLVSGPKGLQVKFLIESNRGTHFNYLLILEAERSGPPAPNPAAPVIPAAPAANPGLPAPAQPAAPQAPGFFPAAVPANDAPKEEASISALNSETGPVLRVSDIAAREFQVKKFNYKFDLKAANNDAGIKGTLTYDLNKAGEIHGDSAPENEQDKMDLNYKKTPNLSWFESKLDVMLPLKVDLSKADLVHGDALTLMQFEASYYNRQMAWRVGAQSGRHTTGMNLFEVFISQYAQQTTTGKTYYAKYFNSEKIFVTAYLIGSGMDSVRAEFFIKDDKKINSPEQLTVDYVANPAPAVAAPQPTPNFDKTLEPLNDWSKYAGFLLEFTQATSDLDAATKIFKRDYENANSAGKRSLLTERKRLTQKSVTLLNAILDLQVQPKNKAIYDERVYQSLKTSKAMLERDLREIEKEEKSLR